MGTASHPVFQSFPSTPVLSWRRSVVAFSHYMSVAGFQLLSPRFIHNHLDALSVVRYGADEHNFGPGAEPASFSFNDGLVNSQPQSCYSFPRVDSSLNRNGLHVGVPRCSLPLNCQCFAIFPILGLLSSVIFVSCLLLCSDSLFRFALLSEGWSSAFASPSFSFSAVFVYLFFNCNNSGFRSLISLSLRLGCFGHLRQVLPH